MPKVAGGLVSNRPQGYCWYSTKDTAFAVFGLTDYLKVSQELSPDYHVELYLNGEQVQIRLQPLRVLRQFGRLTLTLRHEYTHAVIEVLSRGQAARWLTEGLALHVAGDAGMFSHSPRVTELPLDELEHRLASPVSREDMRALYAAAYQRVRGLITAESEASVWRQVAGRWKGKE